MSLNYNNLTGMCEIFWVKNCAFCKLLCCRKGFRGRRGGKAEVPFVHPGSECSLRTHRTPKKMLHFKAPAQLLQALGGPSTQPATSTIIAFAWASFDPSSIFFFSLSLFLPSPCPVTSITQCTAAGRCAARSQTIDLQLPARWRCQSVGGRWWRWRRWWWWWWGRGGLMMSGPCLAWSSKSEHSRISNETTSKTNRDSLMSCP